MKVEVVRCQQARRGRPANLLEGDQIAYLHGHDGDWDIYQAGADPSTGEMQLHRIPDGLIGPPNAPDAYVVLPARAVLRNRRQR